MNAKDAEDPSFVCKTGLNNITMEKDTLSIVTLKKGEGRSFKAGGLWIYDNEIDSITGRFTNGDIVLVNDFDGYHLGKGFINQNSKIRVRMMTRNAEDVINEDFLRMRLTAAWEYRKKVVDTSSCRIIFRPIIYWIDSLRILAFVSSPPNYFA